MTKLTTSLLLGLALAMPSAAEEIPGSTFKSGNWNIAAYTFDDTGAFSHCVMAAAYKSGDTLFFTVNRQATVSVAILSPAIRELSVGQNFPVALYVDRRSPFYGTATVLAESFAGLEIIEFERAMAAFRKGYTLVVEGAGKRGTYDLTGTFRALELTRQCASHYYNYASAPNSPKPQGDKTQMFQVASMIINELGIKRFRYLSAEELAERGWEKSVAWEAVDDGLVGLTLIFPRGDLQDLRTTDADDTVFLARDCKGDYATSARSITLEGDSGDARELRLLCKAEDGQTEMFMTKFLAGESIVYNILAFKGEQAALAPTQRKDKSQAATLRAASFLQE